MITRLLVLASLTILTAVTIILFRLPPKTLQFIAYALLSLFIISAIGVLVFSTLWAKEYYLHKQADRKRAEREARHAKYKVIQDGFGMSHLLNIDTDVIENLSAFPGSHHNGKWEEPHPAAAQAWYALISKKAVDSPVTHLLPPPAISQSTPIDLLKVMTQPTQSYAILGGQQQGKTYQAQLIAQYWQQQNIEVVVIGPKRDKGEWPQCTYYGDGFNWLHLMEGINRVREEALKRHQNRDKGHKQHSIMPVFFDDWTNTRAELETAEGLILDATTLYASVNIVLYFILHLDTANAWGVGKVGAALKDNFIKLRIKPHYQGGMIVREKSTGLLIFPGEREKHEVPLLRGQIEQQQTGLVLQPTKEEQHLINLISAGINSRKQLSESIWGKGKYGKFYNDKMTAILHKWGLEVELL